MTPDVAIVALRTHADLDRDAQMHAYHQIDRPYLGLPNATISDLATEWRRAHDLPTLLSLAQGLWDSDIFEARTPPPSCS